FSGSAAARRGGLLTAINTWMPSETRQKATSQYQRSKRKRISGALRLPPNLRVCWQDHFGKPGLPHHIHNVHYSFIYHVSVALNQDSGVLISSRNDTQPRQDLLRRAPLPIQPQGAIRGDNDRQVLVRLRRAFARLRLRQL